MLSSWKCVVGRRVAGVMCAIGVVGLAIPSAATAEEASGTSVDVVKTDWIVAAFENLNSASDSSASDDSDTGESATDERLAEIAAELVAMRPDGDRGGRGRRDAGGNTGMRGPQRGGSRAGPPSMNRGGGRGGPHAGGFHGRPPHHVGRSMGAWGQGPRGFGPPQRGAFPGGYGRPQGSAALDARLRSIEQKLDALIAESRRRCARDGRDQQARPQGPPSGSRGGPAQRPNADERRGPRDAGTRTPGPGGPGGFGGPPPQDGRGGRGAFGSGVGPGPGGPGGFGGFGGFGPPSGRGFERPEGSDGAGRRGADERRDENRDRNRSRGGDEPQRRGGDRPRGEQTSRSA